MRLQLVCVKGVRKEKARVNMLGALLDAALPSLIQGGASMFGAMLQREGAEEANDLNYLMFRENLDWQERMYKNRHTMEVEDLRRAGLNPVLSANNAGSVPGGSSYASPQNTRTGFGDLAAHSAESSARIATAIEQLKQAKVDTKIKNETKDAAVASIKAAATQHAVNSAKALTQLEFNQSRMGKASIKLNQFLKNLTGRNN